MPEPLPGAGSSLLFPWTEPQRDVGGLHGLPHQRHEALAERVEVRLLAQPPGKLFKRLGRVIFLAVEEPGDGRLDTATQGVEQRGDRQCGDHNGQLWKLLLAGEGTEERLCRSDATEIHQSERGRQGAVDEGAVDYEVYIVEPVTQDGVSGREEYG